GRMGPDNTRRPWICIGSYHKRVLIKWRSCGIRRRVRRRRVSTEKQSRDQAEPAKPSDDAGFIEAAILKPTPGNRECITAKQAVTTVNGGAIVEIGNY